jgi:hypothetical protein
VEDAILKGVPRRTVRAGLVLPPADFAEHIRGLSEKWGREISKEESMSALMYPQVRVMIRYRDRDRVRNRDRDRVRNRERDRVLCSCDYNLKESQP